MGKKRYKIISTFEEVRQIVAWCKETGYASIDFETKATGPEGPLTSKGDKKPVGFQYKKDEPTILGVSFQPGAGYAIPLFHKDSCFTRKEAKKILKYFGKHICENANVIKVAFNLKFEYKWFLRYGIRMRGRLFDAMLAKYLLEETPPSDLKSLVKSLLPEFADYEDEVHGMIAKYKGWGNIPIKSLSKYCVLDCDLTLRLMLVLERLLWKHKFYDLFRNMCMMQTRVLAESEFVGMVIDKPYLAEVEKEQGKKIAITHDLLKKEKVIKKFQKWRVQSHIEKLITKTKEEIKLIKKGKPLKPGKEPMKNVDMAVRNRYEKISRYIAGELVSKNEVVDDVNFASPNQMIELLFTSPKGLGFKIIKYTKDKETKQETDRPSTDEEVLLELRLIDKTGFIQNLLDYRELTKMHSTYMVGILDKLTKHNTLHGNYFIHGTVTGRLSSRDPNMQNIPRATTTPLIKTAFVPPKDHLILEVDYGQAELRVVAEIANDQAMIDIFARKYNIHVATACKSVGKLDMYNEVKVILDNKDHPDWLYWTKLKKRAKVINFGILYQQSAKMLAGTLSEPGDIVTKEEAQIFKNEWLEMYPGVRAWFKHQEKYVMKHGYVMNIFGRKRRLGSIYSNDDGVRRKAMRDSINAPIQSAASDFTQLSSIALRDLVNKGELKLTDIEKYKPQAYTVHDSIGFYVKPEFIHLAVPKIVEVCSSPESEKYFGCKMEKVFLKMGAEVGKHWAGLEGYSIKEDYNKWLN